MYTLVGLVSTRRNARLHLAINGWAYCGAGRGRILGTARGVRTADHGHLCRRCGKALAERLRLDYNIVSRRRDRESRIFADALADMVDQVDPLTRDEVAMLAELAASLTASGVLSPV